MRSRFVRIFLPLFLSGALQAQEDTSEPTKPGVANAEEIAVGSVPEDVVIRERLLKIFNALEGLREIEVEVDAGVVTLRGEVTESVDVEDAIALSGKTDGVVYVRDRIEKSSDVDKRLAPAVRKARDLWQATVRKLPLLLIAVTVVLGFWWFGRWLGKRDRLFRRFGLTELSANMVRQILKLGSLLIGLILALEILDATAMAGAFLGVAGVMGVALGFAFQNIVENYLAGVLLSVRNPFSAGDVIEVENFTGKVIRLTTRDTVLMTLEGNHLRIPNRIIIGSTLVNYTRNPRRRFDFAVGVSVEQDLVAVRELGLETLEGIAAVLDDPPPWVIVEELGDSTVNMRFFGWIDQGHSDYFKSKSEAIRLIKEKFDDVGVEMPEPIYRVHLLDRAGVAQASEEPFKAASSGPKRRGLGEIDTSVDRSIDEQIEEVEGSADEANLLDENQPGG